MKIKPTQPKTPTLAPYGYILGGLISIFPFHALAEPSIQSAVFEQSTNVLTITGSNFGTPGFRFAFLDKIDASLLSVSGELNSYAYQELWEQYGTDWAVPLVPRELSGPLPENKNSLYYGGPGRSNNSYLLPIEKQASPELYVSWNYRPSLDPDKDGGSNKFIRIWDDHSGTHTRISWTQMHLSYVAKDISGSDDISWGGWSGKVDEWNLLEIYVNSEKNIIKAWTNGKLVHDVTNFIKSNTPEGLGVRMLGFDPSFGDPYANMEIFIDNLYVSNTPARVILSTSPTWNSSLLSQSATQLPIRWNDTSIQLNIDLDRLAQEAYIYVIDENRQINQNGFPVSGCSECPRPPDLTIE